MGRHSSESQAAFYRSFAKWLVPWLVIATIVGVGVWMGVGFLGTGPLETQSPASDTQSTESPSGVETTSPTPEPTPTPTPDPTPTVEPEPEQTPKATAPRGNGLTVQVLNGTGVEEANDRVAAELEKLGYEIINLEGASKAYSSTMVYWSYPEARKPARRLAAHFGWDAGPKPENLSATVALHVVVGADEA